MKDVLKQAVEEIHHLRRVNEVLAAKVEVMDLFAVVLHSSPAVRSQGMTEDIAWKLQRVIDGMDKPGDAAAGAGGV